MSQKQSNRQAFLASLSKARSNVKNCGQPDFMRGYLEALDAVEAYQRNGVKAVKSRYWEPPQND